jgi:hypothetical protein
MSGKELDFILDRTQMYAVNEGESFKTLRQTHDCLGQGGQPQQGQTPQVQVELGVCLFVICVEQSFVAYDWLKSAVCVKTQNLTSEASSTAPNLTLFDEEEEMVSIDDM